MIVVTLVGLSSLCIFSFFMVMCYKSRLWISRKVIVVIMLKTNSTINKNINRDVVLLSIILIHSTYSIHAAELI